MRVLTVVPLLLLLACGNDGGSDGASTASEGVHEAAPPADREAWWNGEAQRNNGADRVLAPRELRALLAAGRKFGFDGDAEWWKPRTKWAYAQILAVDPDDIEANSAIGRRTLQSIPGFAALWTRISEARVYNAAMEELLERYAIWIEEERPIFLTEDEYQISVSRLRSARGHLDRMDGDPEYAALQVALERVPSRLRDYPSVRVRAGPFLLFFAAPDLRRIEGESEESENARLSELRVLYKAKLAERAKVLEALVADIRKLYPELAGRYPVKPDEFFFLWIFSDPGWYREFVDSIARERPENRYRCGFFNPKDMWGYFYVPPAAETAPGKEHDPVEGKPDPESRVRETLAYVGAQQLLRHWSRDPEDRFSNRLDKSRAYWLKEGWPSYLAARRVEKSSLGAALADGWRFGRVFPELRHVVERQSRLELARYREPAPDFEEGADQPVMNFGLSRHFTDLSWLLTEHLNDAARRKTFERFLLSQIEATTRGNAEAFAAAFGLKIESDWMALEDGVYDAIEGR